MGLLVSILVLSLLIFVHELGHFLSAKFFGVKVEVFSIGFGKKLYTKIINGTEYAISAIPLGGYVKMKGQDDTNPRLKNYDSDSYNSKLPHQRLIILLAGSAFNFLLAFVLYFFVAILGEKNIAPIIGTIVDNSPAQKAGILSGDKVIEVNGIEIKTWEELSTIIKESNNKPISLLIEREKRLKRVTVTPILAESQNIFGEPIKKPILGISPRGDVIEISYEPFEALKRAFIKTIDAAMLIVIGIQKLIEGVIPTSEIGGVISIVQITSSATESGLTTLMVLTALISVNLGVLNLLPIPALDGGHIMFVLYEIVFKRVPNDEIIYRLTLIGWAVLIALMMLGLYNDLNRLFG